MFYLMQVHTPIIEEIKEALLSKGIGIEWISTEEHFLRKPSIEVAYKLLQTRLDNSDNLKHLKEHIKEACENLEKKNPKIYQKDKLFESLLGHSLRKYKQKLEQLKIDSLI